VQAEVIAKELSSGADGGTLVSSSLLALYLHRPLSFNMAIYNAIPDLGGGSLDKHF
jgi:hypothetical protein